MDGGNCNTEESTFDLAFYLERNYFIKINIYMKSNNEPGHNWLRYTWCKYTDFPHSSEFSTYIKAKFQKRWAGIVFLDEWLLAMSLA